MSKIFKGLKVGAACALLVGYVWLAVINVMMGVVGIRYMLDEE